MGRRPVAPAREPPTAGLRRYFYGRAAVGDVDVALTLGVARLLQVPHADAAVVGLGRDSTWLDATVPEVGCTLRDVLRGFLRYPRAPPGFEYRRHSVVWDREVQVVVTVDSRAFLVALAASAGTPCVTVAFPSATK